MKRVLFTLIILLVSTGLQAANGPCVVSQSSHFRIHVGTGGLFGAFAHDHDIEAQKIEGCAGINTKDLAHSSIKLEFATSGIKVLDPKESGKDRAEVQKTMEIQVLKTSEFPRVTFESTSVEQGGAGGQLRIHGNLTVRGKTQPVVIP